jgi:hypothetical protein
MGYGPVITKTKVPIVKQIYSAFTLWMADDEEINYADCRCMKFEIIEVLLRV